VEEEHRTLFYLTATALLGVALVGGRVGSSWLLAVCPAPLVCEGPPAVADLCVQLAALASAVLLRVGRLWYSGGDKYAAVPGVAAWLRADVGTGTVLMFASVVLLLAVGLAAVFRSRMALGSKVRQARRGHLTGV
jgi:hypothetical protein